MPHEQSEMNRLWDALVAEAYLLDLALETAAEGDKITNAVDLDNPLGGVPTAQSVILSVGVDDGENFGFIPFAEQLQKRERLTNQQLIKRLDELFNDRTHDVEIPGINTLYSWGFNGSKPRRKYTGRKNRPKTRSHDLDRSEQ